MSEVLKNPRLYVESYLKTNNISVNERGELISASGKNKMDQFDTMFLDYNEQCRAFNASENEKAPKNRNKVTPISEKIMQKALNELITEKKIAFRKEVIESLKCTQENLDEVRKFVKALKGEEAELDIIVIAHWLWQIKRKMRGLDPSYHIMPIFYGKQKGGKTVALNKLIAPINNFRLNISMDQMTDDRYYKTMSENYVVVFDEMEGAARTDIDALKKQITIIENDYRPLGTNDVFKVKQACSFIGATNRPVAEQIVDSTGMRRFWQLDCMDKLDWTLLDTVDFVAMWKGIDESKEKGYIHEKEDEIDAKQQELVARDQITSYMDEKGIVAGKEPTKMVTSSALYNDYRNWCQENGVKPLDSNWFGRKISGRGIVRETKKLDKKTQNVYLIPESVVLHSEFKLDLVKTGTW